MVESLFLLLCLSAYTDLRKKIIPNWVCLIVYVLSSIYAFNAGATLILTVIALPLAAFLVLFATYLMGMMGGGDVKLVVALMPLIGFEHLSQFALYTILFGGLVALVVLLHSKVYASRGAVDDKNAPTVPYGVAIAAGAFTVGPISEKISDYFGMIF